MSRLSRSGTLRASSSLSPPATSPLRASAFSSSTSPSSPSPLTGTFSQLKRKDPPLSTAAEYDGIEEEDEVSSSGDSADDADSNHSFAAAYALSAHNHQPQQSPSAVPAVARIVSPTPAQAAVRASALTAALSAVRNVSPSSASKLSPPHAASPTKLSSPIAARSVSPAFGSPLSSASHVSASAPLPATVLRGSHSLAAYMEVDEGEAEADTYHSPLAAAARSPPPSFASSSSTTSSASLDWPPTPPLSQLSDPTLLATLHLSSGQRQRLSSQLSQHVELALALRRLSAASMHSPSAADSDAASACHRKATDLLSSLSALRAAHHRMYSQASVLDVPQLDGLQQRLAAGAVEEAWPAGSLPTASSGCAMAAQPTVAAAVVSKSVERGATRATVAGIVTATAVGAVAAQYATSAWPGGAAMASVLPNQPVMATLGTATPAAAYGAAARLLNHSSIPAAAAQPVAARLVQPALRSASSAVMATTAAGSTPAHTVAASSAAGSLTSALSSLSSSLTSFANSPHHTRSPTPLMASLSLYPAQLASPPTPVTATVMASPTAPSRLQPLSTAAEPVTALPTLAVTVSPPTRSSSSALSASLARSVASPMSTTSPSPGKRSIAVVPATAVQTSEGVGASSDIHATPVSSSFSALSELSSLDSFASLALASYSPSAAASPLTDDPLSALASLAHTDGSYSESSPVAAYTTAPLSASSRSSSYRSSDQPNKRSRSQSQHEPDVLTAAPSAGAVQHALRKNRSHHKLSQLDTTRAGSPAPASIVQPQPRMATSASFNSLSSAVSLASSPSPTSPMPTSASFSQAVPASVLSNQSPHRRTYSPRNSARRVVAASVVLPASVEKAASTVGGGDGMLDGGGLLSPASMQGVAALWSGHDDSIDRRK